MGHGVIKIKDKYFVWSSIVDAPISYGLDLKGLKAWVKREEGQQGLRRLADDIRRVDATGSSAMGWTLKQILSCNRAGPNETHLSAKQIYKQYGEEQKQ